MFRPDGRLSLDLDPIGHGPKDVCGVFGVFAPSEDVAQLTHYGLFMLQHHGQESTGTAVSTGGRITVFKDMGLVSQAFDEATLTSLRGRPSIGRTRCSTTGASVWHNAQPTFRATRNSGLALAHNGSLANTHELESWFRELDPDQRVPERKTMDSTNDTSLATMSMSSFGTELIGQVAMKVLPRLRGAFCLTFINETMSFAVCDPQGMRPLVLGWLVTGWVVASETAAPGIAGASFIREVEPGEFIAIDEAGLCSQCSTEARPRGYLFEHVYLARSDTTIAGRSVHATRVEIGRILACEHLVEADPVIPTPDSDTPSAVGYAEASGIPFGFGLVKNAYMGRMFIQPSQAIRQPGIRLKLNPLKEVIAGKRLAMVDDSIVRGNTQRALVRTFREVRANQVHVRTSSPPVEWPRFHGIDFATRAELIAPGLGADEICRSLGADSLGCISLDVLIGTIRRPATGLCRACFDGRYPIAAPKDQAESLRLEEK